MCGCVGGGGGGAPPPAGGREEWDLFLYMYYVYNFTQLMQDLKMYFLYRQVSLALAEKVLLKDNFEQV